MGCGGSKSDGTHPRPASNTRSASSNAAGRFREPHDDDPWWIKATSREWEEPDGCNELHGIVIGDYSMEHRLENVGPIDFKWLEQKAGDDQVTPLCIAMGLGNYEAYQKLYKFGCDPNVSDVNGVPALHRFIRECAHPAHRSALIVSDMQFNGRKPSTEERMHARGFVDRTTIPLDPNVAEASTGLTALMLTVQLGLMPLLTRLFDHFTDDCTHILDVSAKDKDGKTAMDHAAEWADPAKWADNHAELNKRIAIKKKIDALPEKLRKPALVRAACDGDADKVGRMLDEFVGTIDLNTESFAGKFELESTFKDQEKMFGVPGTLGAVPLGQAPLIFFAALHGQEKVVSLLLERGSKASLQMGSRVNKAYGKISPLWLASAAGHEGVVDQLLSNAGDSKTACANQANGYGVTPLIAAACLGHAGVIRKLAAAGAALDHETSVVDNLVSGVGVPAGGATALHVACWNARDAALEVLIEAGADLNHADSKGHTPLFVCVVKADLPMAFKLLKAGAKVAIHLRRPNDHSLLMAACKNFEADKAVTRCYIVRRLCEQPSVDVNEVNGAGETALKLAVESGAPHLVQLLLEYGADPSLQGTDTRDGEQMMSAWQYAKTIKEERDFNSQEEFNDANACVELCARAVIKGRLKQIESALQSFTASIKGQAAAEELCETVYNDELEELAAGLLTNSRLEPEFFESLLQPPWAENVFDPNEPSSEPFPLRPIGLYCREGAPMTTAFGDLLLKDKLVMLERLLSTIQMAELDRIASRAHYEQGDMVDDIARVEDALTGQVPSANQLLEKAAEKAKANAEEKAQESVYRIARAQEKLDDAVGDEQATEDATRGLMMKMPNALKSSLLASYAWGELTWPGRLEAIKEHCKKQPGSPDPAAILCGGPLKDVDRCVLDAKEEVAKSLIEMSANRLPNREWGRLQASDAWAKAGDDLLARLSAVEAFLQNNPALGVTIADAALEKVLNDILAPYPEGLRKQLTGAAEWSTAGPRARLEIVKRSFEQRFKRLVARRPPRRKSTLRTAPCPLTLQSSGDWCLRFEDGATLHVKLVGGLFMNTGDVMQLKEVADEEKGDGSKRLAFDFNKTFGIEMVLSSFDGETITWTPKVQKGLMTEPSAVRAGARCYWDRMDEDDVHMREARATVVGSQGALFDLNVCHVHPHVTCDGSSATPIAGTRYVCFDRKAMLPPGTEEDLEGETYDLCQSEYDRLPEEKKQLMHALQPGMVAGEALEGSAADAQMRKQFPASVWSYKERAYMGHGANPWCEALLPGRSPGFTPAKRGGLMGGIVGESSDDMLAGFEERFEQALEINMMNFDEQVEAEMRRRLGR